MTGGGWRVAGDGWRVAGDGWRVMGGYRRFWREVRKPDIIRLMRLVSFSNFSKSAWGNIPTR